MQDRFRLTYFVCISILLLTSCSSKLSQNASSERATPETIQEALRERAYSIWDQKFIVNTVGSSASSNVGFEENVALDLSPEVDNSAPPGVDIEAWRAEVSAPWRDIPNDKFQLMCELWFSWFMDPNQLSGNLKTSFSALRQNLQQMSLIPYAYDQVTLVQDNRKTIPYPKVNKPSYLVICRAEVTFETTFGSFNRSYVYLSTLYELKQGKATFIFPSYSSKNIEEK